MTDTQQEVARDDYYALLEVQPDADMEVIRENFKQIAIKYHPDKMVISDGGVMFTKVTQAYDVLSDPCTRAMYDLVVGVIPDTKEERARINRMKRKDAERAVALMEETVQGIVEEEREKNGLIVLDGRYGRLRKMPETGACIDVTTALQCQVQNSSLIMAGGTSKAWLEGFYDPCEEEDGENELYVQYQFLGQVHECVAGDTAKLVIPLQEHLIAQDGLTLLEQQRLAHRDAELKTKRRRRAALYGALALTGIGAYLYKNKDASSWRDLLPAFLQSSN